MIREEIDPFDRATHIMHSLRRGILLTTQAGGRVNFMTIAWGFLGVDWQMPIFVTLVRTNRFSRSLLDANPQFTINVPYGEFDRRILAVAGSKSGYELDKAAELGLRLVPGERVNVPAVGELPLTLECQVIYRKQQDPQASPPESRERGHPQGVPGNVQGINRDYHICYYGAIVAAYLLS